MLLPLTAQGGLHGVQRSQVAVGGQTAPGSGGEQDTGFFVDLGESGELASSATLTGPPGNSALFLAGAGDLHGRNASATSRSSPR